MSNDHIIPISNKLLNAGAVLIWVWVIHSTEKLHYLSPK